MKSEVLDSKVGERKSYGSRGKGEEGKMVETFRGLDLLMFFDRRRVVGFIY